MAAADVRHEYQTSEPFSTLASQVLFEVLSVMAKTPLGKVAN